MYFVEQMYTFQLRMYIGVELLDLLFGFFFFLDKHLYLRNQINRGGKNYGSNFTQGYETKLRTTCSSYSGWNKIKCLQLAQKISGYSTCF